MMIKKLLGIILFSFVCAGCGNNATSTPPQTAPVMPVKSTLEDATGEVSSSSISVEKLLNRSDDPTVVLTVGGRPVTVGEIDTMAMALLKKRGINSSSPDRKEKIRELRPNVMDSIISNYVIAKAAKESNQTVEDASVEEDFEGFKERFKTEKRFLEALALDGLTPETFKETIREERLTRGFMSFEMSMLAQDVEEPTAEAIAEYYDKNIKQFSAPDEVKAGHIFIQVEKGADENAKEALRKKAETIYQLLLTGAPFEKLAQENSDEPSTKDKGGLLGWITEGKLKIPALNEALFKVPEGDFSPVVESDYGYHILKVYEKKLGKAMPLVDVQDDVKKVIKELRIGDLFAKWLKKERESTEIKVENQEIYQKILDGKDLYE